MDKPRILFIVPLPPPVHGSAMVSQYIRQSQLIQDSFQVDFVNLSTSRKMDEIRKINPMKFVRFVGNYFCVLGKLLTHRYDACYLAITCHGMGFLKDAPFVLLCKLLSRNVIIHQHNQGMSKDVNRWFYRWLMPWVYRNTEVILLSWRLYPDVQQIVRKEQVWICPNGIPDVSQPEESEHSVASVPRLFFLSNLLISKGIMVLLDACQQLQEKGYVFRGDYVGGETPEMDKVDFEEEIRLRGLEGVVFYQGPRYGAEKEAFFQQADIFVQPTFDDCFPLTLVEAMQHGLPIVSTDEGAIPDMVIHGENGFICRRKEVDPLVNAIEKLLNDNELRKQMGENGRCRYKERYTLEAFEKKLQEILSGILN